MCKKRVSSDAPKAKLELSECTTIVPNEPFSCKKVNGKDKKVKALANEAGHIYMAKTEHGTYCDNEGMEEYFMICHPAGNKTKYADSIRLNDTERNQINHTQLSKLFDIIETRGYHFEKASINRALLYKLVQSGSLTRIGESSYDGPTGVQYYRERGTDFWFSIDFEYKEMVILKRPINDDDTQSTRAMESKIVLTQKQLEDLYYRIQSNLKQTIE